MPKVPLCVLDCPCLLHAGTYELGIVRLRKWYGGRGRPAPTSDRA